MISQQPVGKEPGTVPEFFQGVSRPSEHVRYDTPNQQPILAAHRDAFHLLLNLIVIDRRRSIIGNHIQLRLYSYDDLSFAIVKTVVAVETPYALRFNPMVNSNEETACWSSMECRRNTKISVI